MKKMDQIFMAGVKRLPRHAITRAVGVLTEQQVPRSLRAPIYKTFAKVVGAKLEEAALPVTEYPTFNEFFARQLKEGARSWDTAADEWGMPADGVLSIEGRVSAGMMIQAKGIDYSVEEFLGEDPAAWEGARFATVYLSPADYHRVHWPVSGSVSDVRAMGGELWPVNGPSVRTVPQLLVQNERTVTRMTDAAGRPAAVVMVAATVVGGIELEVPSADENAPVHVEAGAEHGRFLMGSTVVLLVQDRKHPLADAQISADTAVRLGQALWAKA